KCASSGGDSSNAEEIEDCASEKTRKFSGLDPKQTQASTVKAG
ncbi:unnamed protein product, partial [Allacma fusca]